ncbi:hypothetical protein JKF63_05332 [Porcisia hertigi]|uniref:Cullin family profile domain-containing protein n=1 Tax=Porcisia hertigi TaxID=2761500 RepID=A0A836INL0_9TRYP|nr:hypothetical protein JKF63_05332 [Porcisia hertigi]
MQIALLLSRSIRDQNHGRAIGGASRDASVHRNDDHRAAGGEFPETEALQHLGRHTAASPPDSLSTSCPSTPIPVPSSTTPTGLEMSLQFESLWSNIDRYLFAVYTTLQTGDESSLRPLRAPKHRMGWYTVIYNACSGDPTKSRQFYTRLALLLQKILETHVLFPVLQNVDRSQVQFLTCANDNVQMHSSESAQHRQRARSSSLREGRASGHGNGNSSFTFVKRLLQPLSQLPTMTATSASVDSSTNWDRPPGSSARRGVTSTSGRSSPPNPVSLAMGGICNPNNSSCNSRASGAFAPDNEPPSAFAGFSTGECAESTPITSPQRSSVTQTHTPLSAASGTGHYSTQRIGNTPTESGRSSCMNRMLTSSGETARPSTHSTLPSYHARIASKTGRVLVDDEEEVLCETNTVWPPAHHSPRRLQPQTSSSSSSSGGGGDSAAAPASCEDEDEDSLHTMDSSLSSDTVAPEGGNMTGGNVGGDHAHSTTPHKGPRESKAAQAEAGPLSAKGDKAEPAANLVQPPGNTITPLPSPKVTSKMHNTSPSASAPRTSPPPERVTGTISITAAGGGVRAASRSSLESTAAMATATSTEHAVEAPRTDEHRFSLCYTFLQEWQTFLVFRRVVLSCFRYLDQYYTRRFGMDTITLMCFKMFYVVIYEPLRPLLSIELRHLVQYVREVFEMTAQVAWKQLELTQDTYSTITELLLLVQSTSSSMVAQQQQQQQKAGSGVVGGGNGGAAAAARDGVSSVAAVGSTHITSVAPRFVSSSLSGSARSQVAPPATTPSAVVETSALNPASNRDGDITSVRNDSAVSSVVTTPHATPRDACNSGNTAAATEGGRSGAHPHVSRRRRLLSLFTSGRLGDGTKGGSGGHNSDRDQRSAARATSIPASPLSPTPSLAGLPFACGSDSGRLSTQDEVGSTGTEAQGGAAKADPIPEPAVVVDLRGILELRDRLEGHTAAHHLTNQALKQWEGMAADRRPRLGTIVKVIAKPLRTIVMEDVGNEYIAGMCSFYRCAREAHRSTDEGRRGYVNWALGVKELERHVWQRVQLPFLHASLRSALNEVLVVEPHRSILLDSLFGLRALLDGWSASLETADLSLAPLIPIAMARSGGAEAQAGSSSATAAAATHRQTGSATTLTSPGGGLSDAGVMVSSGVQCGDSMYLEPLMPGELQSSRQRPIPSLSHQGTTRSLFFDLGGKHEAASTRSFRTSAPEESGDRHGRGVLSGAQWVNAARSDDPTDTTTVTSAIHRGSHGSEKGQPSTGTVESALIALESLYRLFSDVTEDECFVLMAAIVITKFTHDAADIIERYVRIISGAASATPSQAHLQAHGTELMANLVELVVRYMDLVEGVFHNHSTVLRALSDAIEELICPSRWTRKGALQASQQRAHNALMTAVAAATARASGDPMSESASSAGADLPSVLLSRDARETTLPLVALAASYPQAVQQLKPSALLAHYADAFLQQECGGGGRVLTVNLYKRLRLIARLVALLEEKDTFLEHYRLCLARRLLGYSSGAAPRQPGSLPGTTLAVVDGSAKPPSAIGRVPQGTCVSASLNLEAERQLVGFLQSYLGVTSTRAFEAMLRDYEGTERTRDLFEHEPAYLHLPAKIRVQLITSAHWPTYAMPALQPHATLQRGMEVFRVHYARQHPSRTLLWVFSLGTATLTAELVSGTKQVVASTILATLLLVLSDAYNAPATDEAQAGALTGTQLAHTLGLPFHDLRPHLHLLTQHRAFNLLRWAPVQRSGGTGAAAIMECDYFSLNPSYTHKLRKIRLPMPKTRLTGLPAGVVNAIDGDPDSTARPQASSAAPATATVSEDVIVTRHVQASRRVLLDAALVRTFKSRRVVSFEDLLQLVTAHLSPQFVPSRRDIKAQLEGLIDRDYVKRDPRDPNTFVYLS